MFEMFEKNISSGKKYPVSGKVQLPVKMLITQTFYPVSHPQQFCASVSATNAQHEAILSNLKARVNNRTLHTQAFAFIAGNGDSSTRGSNELMARLGSWVRLCQETNKQKENTGTDLHSLFVHELFYREGFQYCCAFPVSRVYVPLPVTGHEVYCFKRKTQYMFGLALNKQRTHVQKSRLKEVLV